MYCEACKTTVPNRPVCALCQGPVVPRLGTVEVKKEVVEEEKEDSSTPSFS
jgi:hypothetical protein